MVLQIGSGRLAMAPWPLYFHSATKKTIPKIAKGSTALLLDFSRFDGGPGRQRPSRSKMIKKKGWSESSNVINMRDINGILMGYSKMGAMWAMYRCMEVQLHGRFLKPTGKTIWLRRGLGKSVTPSREPEFFMGFVWSWEFLLQIFEPRPAFDLIRCFWFDQMWVPSWCQTMSRRF